MSWGSFFKKAPAFWRRSGWRSDCLLPFALIYFAVRRWQLLRARRRPVYRASVPLICVGNPVVGGAGKTPVVLTLAKFFNAHGMKTACVLRGYGGKESDVPVLVNPSQHDVTMVGDEALLLAEVALCVVGADRVACCRLAEKEGAEIILMDDGMHRPEIYKDLTLIVVDGFQGLGNGMMLPCGPLRDRLDYAMLPEQCEAFVVVMTGQRAPALRKRLEELLPLVEAPVQVVPPVPPKDRAYVAFCGIGVPEKFEHSLQQQGLTVKAFEIYADHHPYSEKDLAGLKLLAEEHEAALITTEKDLVRLPKAWQEVVSVLKIETVIAAPALEYLCEKAGISLRHAGEGS